MQRRFPGYARLMGVTASLLILVAWRSASAVCLGDCNDNGTVTAGELTKIIAVILQCGGTASGCAAVSGGCVPADKNGNGIISAGELTNVIFDILNFPNGCPAVETPTVPAATPTPTPTATSNVPPLGLRVFALNTGPTPGAGPTPSPGSGFFSSLISGAQGVPMGTLKLNAGPLDAQGRATVTLGEPTVIQTDLPLGGLTLCTRLESCTGTIYCDGGTDVDVLSSLDSLKSGLSCLQDGSHGCAPPPTTTPGICCSNACEGVCTSSSGPTPTPGGVPLPTPTPCVNSGNSVIQTSPPPSVTPGDSGPGAMLLICMQRTATVSPIGDCADADFASAGLSEQYYTTGIDTTQVLNHCVGSGAPPNRLPRFARKGTNFDCSNWTMQNGPGVLAFTIPSEEGSSAITGDGANGGLWSDK